MECLKVDLRKVDFKKSASWNVWKQFGVDIDTYKGTKINVTKHYMPEEEQNKLVEYMLKNYKKLKEYKHYRKEKVREALGWERLCYFPTSVKK